jgi:hypothetical protein
MKTYILRIYRFKEGYPKDLVGIVEEVGQKGKKAFTNYDELWETLSASKPCTQYSKDRKEAK